MLSSAVKSNELKFKVFYHGLMDDLVKEMEEWLGKVGVEVLDISYVVPEETGWIFAVVMFKLR